VGGFNLLSATALVNIGSTNKWRYDLLDDSGIPEHGACFRESFAIGERDGR
jgi:hypothetical protein